MFPMGRVATLTCTMLLTTALPACSNDPYFTKPPDKLLNRYAYHPPTSTHDKPEDPYLISLCYGRQSDDPEQVMERAQELCPAGNLVVHSQDGFWNDCALFHPVRINLICDPSDHSD